MKTDNIAISFVIPVYNEKELLKRNVAKLMQYCQKNKVVAEILLCENGSTDGSREIIKKIRQKNIRKIYLNNKGLGGAYRAGILASKLPIVYFTGIDFPFGLKNILDCHRFIDQYDFVLASKAHPKSKITTSFKRKLSSAIYRLLLKTFLNLKIGDPQGCVMFRRKKIITYLALCDSRDAFFSTQLALYGEMNGLRMIEIPVRYLNPRKGSKISVVKDGLKMYKQIISERRRIRIGNARRQGKRM